jgi:hypothetical protein
MMTGNGKFLDQDIQDVIIVILNKSAQM